MAKIGKTQEISVEKLRPYEKNAKKHPQEQIDLICRSINEYGFLNPCLIDKDYNVIAGHGRIMAAKQMGMDKVPCLFVEGLSEEQYRAYVLADNKLTELGEWDQEILAQELQDLADAGFDIDLTGFTMDDAILDLEPIDDNGIGAEIDEFLKSEPITEKGDIWQLGNHRLMVGDSTSIDDVQKLVGGGRYGPSGDRSTI